MISTNILKHTATVAAFSRIGPLAGGRFSGLGTGVNTAGAGDAPGLAQARSNQGCRSFFSTGRCRL